MHQITSMVYLVWKYLQDNEWQYSESLKEDFELNYEPMQMHSLKSGSRYKRIISGEREREKGRVNACSFSLHWISIWGVFLRAASSECIDLLIYELSWNCTMGKRASFCLYGNPYYNSEWWETWERGERKRERAMSEHFTRLPPKLSVIWFRITFNIQQVGNKTKEKEGDWNKGFIHSSVLLLHYISITVYYSWVIQISAPLIYQTILVHHFTCQFPCESRGEITLNVSKISIYYRNVTIKIHFR